MGMGPLAPFKPSLVMGLNDAAVDAGYYRWPSEKVGFEVCARLAADLQGPDALDLPGEGLGRRSGVAILTTLKAAADRLAAEGHGPDALSLLHQKQASALALSDRAARVAEAYMAKAAAEGGSLTDVGENTPDSAAMDNQHAKLDLHNRSVQEYLVGVGNTGMPSGGVVGKELAHPKRQQNSPPISNSATAHTAKAANLTDLYHGGLAATKNVFKNEGVQGGLAMLGRHAGETARAHPVATAASLGAVPLAAALAAKARKPHAGGEAHLAALALGKQADEDMATADLGGAAPQGAMPQGAMPQGAMPQGAVPDKMARAKAMLAALLGRFHHAPSPEAQLATAGLAEHPQGMDVMASVLDRAKTAEDADAILQEILQHQGQVGQLASPELVAALQQLLEGGEGPEGGEDAALPPGAAPPGMPPGAPPAMPPGGPPKEAGARDLLARLTASHAAPGPHREAALLAHLHKLAEGGSLTGVGKNTPEGAAKDDQHAALDNANRPPGEYLEGQGKTTFPNKGQQYAVAPNKAHEAPVAADTVPARETKGAAAEPLTAEDAEYVAQLRKVAEQYGGRLPAAMPQDEKVAHIRQLHARAPRERAAYVAALAG